MPAYESYAAECLCGVDGNQDKGWGLGQFFPFFLGLGIREAEGGGATRRYRRLLAVACLHRLLAFTVPVATAVVAIGLGLALIGLLLLRLLLHRPALRHKDSVIMFGVLEIVLLLHPIASRTRIARELEIFFIDARRRAADLDVRTRRIERPIMIVMTAMASVAAAMTTMTTLRPAAAPSRTFHVNPSSPVLGLYDLLHLMNPPTRALSLVDLIFAQ
jgi:hypothetical protein